MIALVAVVLAIPASAETVEVRGNVADAACAAAGITWDAYNFAVFWYDLDDDLSTESLVLEAGAISDSDRTIDENYLSYTTTPVYQCYELWCHEALIVDGDTYNLERGYYIEGWLGETYIAVNGNADKLVKLLVEFEDDGNKTLSVGEEWGLGGGFTLTAKQIDIEGDKVWLILGKDGKELDSEVITTGGNDMNDSVYTYTVDLANEEDVPVFSCLVDMIDRDTNTIEIMYVFLIDNDVLEIDNGDTFGVMGAIASSSQVILRNEYTIDLDPDTTEHIMGNMYFETADDDRLRFYPYVEYAEPGTYEVRGNVADAACAAAGITWDAHNFAAFWYDLDDDLSTECLVLAAGAISDSDRTINENYLTYTTTPVYQHYELWSREGLVVDGDTYNLERGYSSKAGWEGRI